MPIDPLNPASPARQEFVREKAYEIYQQRGKERGHAADHWLEAERELTARQRRRRDSLLLKWTH